MRDGASKTLIASGLILALAVGMIHESTGLALGYQGPGGPEVLARGPLHEAFAAPVVYNATPGAVVPKQPPDPVEEQPPDQKPVGGDVEWIPGYWAWDDERQDFLWISGIWRDIPPGRQWTPGYWIPADGGFRWVSGFWSPVANGGQMNYLPAPPQSLEVGPNSPQPGQDFLWSPGSWAWYENRYLWRPGFWVQAQPEWVWVPPSYVPTPGGYVFVDGYWDHPIDRRGMIYAPVAFAPNYLVPGYVYTPAISLSIGGLTANLFVRPSYGAYYFGDYYGYASAGPSSGFVAWFSFQSGRRGYDPLYASMAANHWRDPQWSRTIRTEYIYRVEHVDARPAPTFAAQRAIVEQRRARGEEVRGMEIAHVAGRSEPGRRMEPVHPQERARIAERSAAVREASQGRARVEAQARAANGPRPEEHRPQSLMVPHSSIASRTGAEPRDAGHARPGAAPPAHPEGHAGFRPTMQHQEPARNAGRAEPRRGIKESTGHSEPRGKPKEGHREPKL